MEWTPKGKPYYKPDYRKISTLANNLYAWGYDNIKPCLCLGNKSRYHIISNNFKSLISKIEKHLELNDYENA